jgi:hypothetical protein
MLFNSPSSFHFSRCGFSLTLTGTGILLVELLVSVTSPRVHRGDLLPPLKKQAKKFEFGDLIASSDPLREFC